jgi:hypothetical protein
MLAKEIKRGCVTCSEYNASYSICSDKEVGGEKCPFLTYANCQKWHNKQELTPNITSTP